jgi:hypothetical protein
MPAAIHFRIFVVPCANKNIKLKYAEKIWSGFYEYETEVVTIREEHRLTEFENRMLREIFGFKKE